MENRPSQHPRDVLVWAAMNDAATLLVVQACVSLGLVLAALGDTVLDGRALLPGQSRRACQRQQNGRLLHRRWPHVGVHHAHGPQSTDRVTSKR